jgi:hypothetical protein
MLYPIRNHPSRPSRVPVAKSGTTEPPSLSEEGRVKKAELLPVAERPDRVPPDDGTN